MLGGALELLTSKIFVGDNRCLPFTVSAVPVGIACFFRRRGPRVIPW